MNDPSQMNTNTGKSIVIPEQTFEKANIRLSFSAEPNREAPALIRELFRHSYLNRLSSESRCKL